MNPMPNTNLLTLKRLSALACITLVAPALQAGVVNSGSNGSDGDLVIGQAGEYYFDPATTGDQPLDVDGDNVYHFTSVTIAEGAVVKMRADKLGSKPVIWLSSGAVNIAGTLDLNGESGHHSDALHLPAIAGAGGYQGGAGGTSAIGGQVGGGPGSGGTNYDDDYTCGSGYGTDECFNAGRGASHSGDGSGNGSGKTYGNRYLVPLVGGSGGGGGDNGAASGGGGAGGGAIMIVSNEEIKINGSIAANGGGGGLTTHVSGDDRYGNGGGGSGGAIRLVAPIISGTGSLSVAGGTASKTLYGADGRLRLEAFTNNFSGSVAGGAQGSTVFSTPGIINPPSNAPYIKVVSVNGETVPANADSSFDPADMTLNADGSVDIVVETYNVPRFSTIKLTITNEVDGIIEHTASVATAPDSNGKATTIINATIPHGFSRFTTEATWSAPAS